MNKRLKFKCLNTSCNNVFETKFAYLLYASTSCPNCVSRSNGYSKGEAKIYKYLTAYNTKFIQEYRFENCRSVYALPFDFYLPENNMVIEYNGKQHYDAVEYFGGKQKLKQQQKHDQIKRDYCIKNNIKLIEIPYWDFDNIEQILIKELMLDETKISSDENSLLK